MQFQLPEICGVIPDAINAIADLLERIVSIPQEWISRIFDWLSERIEWFAPIVKPCLTEVFRIVSPCIDPIRFLCCATYSCCGGLIPCPLLHVCVLSSIYPQLSGYMASLLQPLCYL
jgi:hypothetical protein